MLAMLLAERPAVVSFHFGLPPPERISALRDAGIVLLAHGDQLPRRGVAAAGVDAVVAQGYEAGGHRGVFDPDAPDDRLGTMALTRLLVRELDLPVIAAGGIMDGAGIAAALRLGAGAAQLGTAFIACPSRRPTRAIGRRWRATPPSHGDDARRSPAARRGASPTASPPRRGRPLADDDPGLSDRLRRSGRPLHAAAGKGQDYGLQGAQWAGQGRPPRARRCPQPSWSLRCDEKPKLRSKARDAPTYFGPPLSL